LPAARPGRAVPVEPGQARCVRRTLFRSDRPGRDPRQGAAALGGMKALLAAALLVAATPAIAVPDDRWGAEIAEASARFAIPGDWIRRVIRAESGGQAIRGGRPVVSAA